MLFAGSDLLISLTSTFDQKWKSLRNQSRIILSNTNGNTNVLDEKKRIHYESDNTLTKVFRDPSLHRSVGEISHHNCKRNVRLLKFYNFVLFTDADNSIS